MPAFRPKINFGDFSGLKEKGVSDRTLDALKSAVAKGVKLTSRADLIRNGLNAAEADLVAAEGSLSTNPLPKPVTLSIPLEPKGQLGYALGIVREDTLNKANEETLLPIPPEGTVSFQFDDAVTGPNFELFVKAPNGQLVDVKLGTETAQRLRRKKTDLVTTSGVAPTLTFSPVKEITTAKKTGDAPPTRLKGRLLAANPKLKVEKLQILFEVALKASPAEADFFPIGFATTETDGYFFTSQLQFPGAEDFRKLTAARARIAIPGQPSIAIRLQTDATGAGRLPERLILFLPTPGTGADEGEEAGQDCSCGDCTELDFHDRKVLDEFSYFTVVRTTEPLIEAYQIDEIDEIELDELLDQVDDPVVRGTLSGLRANRNTVARFLAKNQTINKANVHSLVQTIQADALLQKTLRRPPLKKGRVVLEGAAEIDWDEKPTVYQAVSIAHGHLLQFKQEWFHDGYSIGDLLYSLPLAPGQKKQIVVFDWDRKESAANVQQLDYQESLYNSLSRDRDVNEVANATLREEMRGSSESSTSAFGAGLGIGAIIPTPVPLGALLGVGGGVGRGSSSARQSASRTSTASSAQHVSDRTVQAANAIRSQRATVIQTVSQGERFQVSAEVVANYNHCHAMTVQYFEVLRHFEIRTRLADVRECLFVPLKLSTFTPKKVLRWRMILERCLRRRELLPAFAALHRIEEERESASENYYDSIGLPKDRFAEEELNYLEGELFLEFQLSRPRNNDADEFVLANWNAFAPFLGDPLEFYNLFLKGDARKDEAFAKHAGPRIAQAVMDELLFFAERNAPGGTRVQLPLEATLVSDFRHRARLNVSLRLTGPLAGIRREQIDFIRISLDGARGRNTLLQNLTNEGSLRVIVHSGTMRYRTRNLHEPLFVSSSIRNDLTAAGDDVRIFCPLSERALRRPRLEDVELANALLAHCNENLEYYHQCIWTRMDPQRRFMLLDGVVAPGRANGRSVASVVENRLIGVVGNCLVLPVAPGYQLDPVLDRTVDLLEHYYEEPLDPTHVSLPTKGVFAEAVMGKCNSCEKKDEERFWRWEESPIPDSPTTIQPVVTPVPTVTTPNLTAKDFPNPIVTVQTAPALPDPQGFSALATLLGNANLFRDITGLTENQKNALAALQSSLQTAQNFGQGAAQLTGQAAELFKFNKLSEMLAKGQISKDDFKGLIEKGQNPELNEIKSIEDAAKKKEIDPESATRLKDAKLKKAEAEAGKSAEASGVKAAVSEAVASFADSSEGTLEVADKDGTVTVSKGGVGKASAPKESLFSVDGSTPGMPADKLSLSLEGYTQSGKKKIEFAGTNSGTKDFVLHVDWQHRKVDEDGNPVLDKDQNETFFPVLKATQTLLKGNKDIRFGTKTMSSKADLALLEKLAAEPENRSVRVTKVAGNPDAKIAKGTLFLFPFPLSTAAAPNEFTVAQPAHGATGSGTNTTHTDKDPENRFAVDFDMPMGTEVFAMRDGVVEEAVGTHPDLPIGTTPTEADNEKANVVRVLHDDGTYTNYVHLQKDSVKVKAGDAVKAGVTVLGLSGNSGFSTGPHLHVSVSKLHLDKQDLSSTSFRSLSFFFEDAAGNATRPAKGAKVKRVR